MSSGMVRMSRYPRTAHTMASPMPVLPLVGSTTVAPALRRPRRSASSIMLTAIRSFTLPPGLSDSILARTTPPPGFGNRLRRTSGVPPTTSSTEAAMRGRTSVAVFRCVMATNPIGNDGSPLKKGSDVIHRLGRFPPLGRVPSQILERGAVHHRVHRFRHRAPQIRQVPAGVGRRAPRGASGHAEPRTPLDGAKECAHGDLLGRFGEPVAARRTAARVEKACALESQKHLLQVALRNALTARDVLDRLQGLAVVRQRQVEHRLDGILPLGGDGHAPLRSKTRATSLAKYVMTMSAPARRMPVSASIMAASSSSHPS